MDADEIIDTLLELGIDQGKIRPYKGNIATACPLSPWTHAKGYDKDASCMVKVAENEPSLFMCWSESCGQQGLFKNLVLETWRKLGRPRKLADLVEKVLEREKVDFEREFGNLGAALFGKPHKTRQSASEIEAEAEVWDETFLDHPDFQRLGRKSLFFKRGCTERQEKAWEVRFDKFEERIIFPVRRHDQKLVGIVGRVVGKKTSQKYKNYNGFPKTRFLYGEHKIPDDVAGLILSEGPLDVLAVERAIRKHPRYGKFRPLGVLGADFAPRQAKKVLAWNVPVYIFLDNDSAGREGAEKVISKLAGRVLSFQVNLPSELNGREVKDAGDLTPAEVIEALDTADAVGEGRPEKRGQLRCAECGKHLSKRDKECPKCGTAAPKTGKKLRKVGT